VVLKRDFQRAVLQRNSRIIVESRRTWRDLLFVCEEYHAFATVGETNPTRSSPRRVSPSVRSASPGGLAQHEQGRPPLQWWGIGRQRSTSRRRWLPIDHDREEGGSASTPARMASQTIASRTRTPARRTRAASAVQSPPGTHRPYTGDTRAAPTRVAMAIATTARVSTTARHITAPCDDDQLVHDGRCRGLGGRTRTCDVTAGSASAHIRASRGSARHARLGMGGAPREVLFVLGRARCRSPG
jgi:hypothetical protein